jgi:AcrR family transcriptional regulator
MTDVGDSKRPRRTQVERSEIAVRSFLEEALKIVAERGSARMTLTDVGMAAGYSRGNPGRHFGTKAVLIKQLARHLGSVLVDLQARIVGRATGLDYVQTLAQGYLRADDPTALRALHIMQAEAIMSGSEVAGEMRTFNELTISQIEHHIRVAVAADQIPPVEDPTVAAIMIVGLVRGVVVQWLVDDSLPIDQIRTEIPDVVARILGVPPSD